MDEGVFRRAWRVLRENPIIVVPWLLVELATMVARHLAPPSGPATYPPHLTARDWTDSIVEIALWIVAACYYAGMANAAWRTGSARLSDGTRALVAHGRDLALLTIIVDGGFFAVVLFPMSLLSYAYVLVWAVLWFCAIWTVASIVVGGRHVGGAFRESVGLTAHRFGKTLWLNALVSGAFAVGASGREASVFPGLLTACVASGLLAYLSIVLVGEYLRRREVGDELLPVPQGRGGAGTP